MITVGEAFENMGFELKDSETVCIVSINDGDVVERSLHDVADLPVSENLYYSTGTFPRKQRFGKGGRNLTNVERILEFPFDFDLKDFLGFPDDRDVILNLSQEEVDSYCQLLRVEVENAFAKIGLPIHRLDYTGNGLAAHTYIPAHEKESVAQLKKWHAAIVTRINAMYGSTLADLQVKDAGPRIMRLVPSQNIKITEAGEVIHRQPKTLALSKGFVDQAVIENAADMIVWQGSKAEIPYEGDHLTPDEMQSVIDTYAPFHTPGQKHFLALAIAGQLAKMRVPEEQALQIIEAISREDKKPWDRKKSVHDTYNRVRNGEIVAGYSSLKNMVSDPEIQAVDQILEKAKKRNGPVLVFKRADQDVADPDTDIKLFDPPPVPDDAFYGWHKDWLDLVYPTTAAASAFHLAASTSFQAGMMGRKISTIYSGDQIYPNQYAVVIGRTGNSFKDTAYKRTMQMAANAKKAAAGDKILYRDEFKVVEDFASREALVDTLHDSSNVYHFSSEITTLFNNATRESTSSLLDALIRVWDTPTELPSNSMRARKENRESAQNPYLVIYGGTQPNRIGEYMTETMISSGLGNRMAFFMGMARGKLARTPRLDFDASVEMYHRLREAIASYPDGYEIELSDNAGTRFDDWYYSLPEEIEELHADMRVRHPVMVHKWALLFAVADQSREIEVRHLDAALSLTTWMWECIEKYLPSWGVSNERKIEERIITVLKQRQPMSKRDLNRYVRGKWTAKEFAGVFRAMKENQQIAVSEGERYVALSEMDLSGVKESA